ncbi:MAG: phosphotransferase system HPr (HPr) family protein [Candidatus Omnitrophota bacterium]|jgi:phosphotransferase system HPr (HPr) family protein
MSDNTIMNSGNNATISQPASIQIIKVTVSDRGGLSLRVAVELAKRMRQFKSVIRVRMGNALGSAMVNGKDVMQLLLLEAPFNTTLFFESYGSDAKQSKKSINTFFINTIKFN